MTNHFSRRNFLKTSAAAATVAAMGTNFAFAQGQERIKVGLVGCGGRGTGAATDAIMASPQVDVVAMGDLFKDRLESSKAALGKLEEKYRPQVKVADDKCFVGFDAYQKVIDLDLDYVILTTPPGFRPMHYAYAVEKGRHCFAEKPVAVDPAGVRKFIETSKIAESKKLCLVGGFVFRRDKVHMDTIEKIHKGAIGDVLSGDHIVEQAIHRIDIQNWVMNSIPVSAYGMGGRQVRTDPAYGCIYDHFAVEYEYPNGAKVVHMCRQTDGTDPRIEENYWGTKGQANPAKGIKGDKDRKKEEKLTTAYVQEHVDLIAAIKSGKTVNEGVRLAESSLTAIMGRMSAYTGKLVTWDQAMQSKQDLWPKEPLAFGPKPVPPVAMPGKEPLV